MAQLDDRSVITPARPASPAGAYAAGMMRRWRRRRAGLLRFAAVLAALLVIGAVVSAWLGRGGSTPSPSTSIAVSPRSGLPNPGLLRTGDTNLLAHPALLAGHAGATVTGSRVLVESVVADEGFWVGRPDRRVFVRLAVQGESRIRVRAGDRIDLHGTVQRRPAGFEQHVGVTTAEGAALLRAQGYYINATSAAHRR